MATFREAFKAELEAIGRSDGSSNPAATPPTAEPVIAYCGCTGDATSPPGCPDDGAEPFVIDVPRDLVGLALSGGGIRSATFNLGLLQGLSKRDLLKHFDYLSTVSGGGYIGSFWSAWRARADCTTAKGVPKVDTPAKTGSEPDVKPATETKPGVNVGNAREGNALFPTDLSSRSEPDAIRHLREFSRFLSPRWGLLEIETWQFFGNALSAIVPALLVGFSLLTLLVWYVLVIGADTIGGNQVISIWRVRLPYQLSYPSYVYLSLIIVAVSMVLAWFERTVRKQPWRTYFAAVGFGALELGVVIALVIWICSYPVTYLYLSLIVVTVSMALVIVPFELATRAIEKQPREPYYEGWYVGAAVLGTVVALATVYLLLFNVGGWSYFKIMPGLNQSANDRVRFFAPAIGWSVAMLVLIFLRGLATRFISNPKEGSYRAAVDRVIARLLAMAVFWTVMILFVFASYFLWTRSAGLTALWTTGIGAGSGGIFGYIQRLLARQPSRAKGGLVAIAQRYALPLLATIFLVAAGVGVACYVFTSINSASINLTFINATSINFTSIDYRALFAGGVLPLAVLMVALVFYNPNEIGMHPLYRSRLSRAYLGASNRDAGSAAQNRQSIERLEDDISLACLSKTKPVHLICCTANDLSGNHLANLRRGARSATLSKFGFTLANRFKEWGSDDAVTLATAMTASAAAFNSNMGSLSMDIGPAAAFLMASLNLRLGYWHHLTRKRWSRIFPGIDLLYEMLSLTNSGLESEAIHLSDGGHFENLALYELLRRRCKYILASDCGADPDAAFDDVGNALRRAREDFGVEVDIDLAVLKPDGNGFSRQHVAVGDLTYPGGDRGILLVFKPTLVGDEPGDVLQYKTRNSSFPHESTGDQFYDEKQWESYRRLGLHAARIAFRSLDERDAVNEVSEVFGAARWEWLPVPQALSQQLLARGSELDQIERQVMGLDSVSLRRDLYPELQWQSGVPRSSDMSAEELAKVVPLFTQVLQLMENVYVSCELERYWTHPLNVGWVNWFGRWATTPAFRMLWPFLAPMFNPRMTGFVEDKLELVSKKNPPWSVGVAEDLRDGKRTVALEIWEVMHPGANRKGYQKLSYQVTTEYGREIGIAILFFKKEDSVMTWTETWNNPDFFVPPSFWGAGIGNAFLDAIVKRGSARVRIHDDPARRTQVSDTVQFYSAAGFRISPPSGSRPSDSKIDWIEMTRHLTPAFGLAWPS